MGKTRRLGTESLVEFDMLRCVGKVILATDDMGDFHLDIIDDIHEVENPGAIRTTQGDVWMCSGVGEIKFYPAADFVLEDDLLTRGSEADGTVVFIEMASFFKASKIFIVDGRPFALVVGSVGTSFQRAFIPVETEPVKSVGDNLLGLFGVAGVISVLDAEHKGTGMLAGIDPIKESGTGSADMQEAGRGGGKTCADRNGRLRHPSKRIHLRHQLKRVGSMAYKNIPFSYPMTLAEQIDNDLKVAMKARDAARLSTLRMVKSALKNAAIEKGGADTVIDDELATSVLRKQIKQREDAAAGFEQGGRPELAAKEKEEIVLLAAYLPTPLTLEEIVAIVKESIVEVGAALGTPAGVTKAQMGAVMKAAQAKAQGRADGKILSAEVQKHLS